MTPATTVRPHFPFARFLQARVAHTPVFTHDGAQVAFVSDITGVPQLWQVPVKGGWPDQITFTDDRVTAGHYAHGSDTLVFGMDSGGDEREQLFVLRDGEQRDLVVDPTLLHNFGSIARDDSRVAYSDNRRHPAYFDVYTSRLDGSDERCVLQHDGSNYALDWSPDAARLLLSRTTGALDNELFVLDTISGEVIHLSSHDDITVYLYARFTPDGRNVVLLTNHNSEFVRAALMNIETHAITFLTPDDVDVDWIALSPDGRQLALVRNADGYGRLSVRAMEGGQERDAPLECRGVPMQPEWSPDSSTLAFALTAPACNSNVWVWEVPADTCRQITHVGCGGIPQATFVQPEIVRYPTFDGRQIPAFLYLPEVDRPPVVVIVHGGPEGQTQPIFNPVTQYFVNRGYAVLAPNVRGSTGYGRTYTHLDDVDKRMDSVADLKAAADWLRASSRVDGERIAVMGGSYGGFMVLSALTTYPETWTAGVDIVGIANFLTFLCNTSAYRRQWRIPEYGDPDRDAGLLERISPINHVDQIRVPLIVIHGDNDPRVPLTEAEQMVDALRARDVPVEFLHFDDEGHGILKLKNKLVAYPAIGEFLDRVLE